MKKIIFTLFILSFCQIVIAQNLFAPVGAEWYHNGGYSNIVYHSQVTNDTVISSTKCRVIKQKVFMDSFFRAVGFPAMSQRNLYVYDANDTVFIYNELYERFTPLYVFNVSVGDTVRLPVIYPASSCVKIDTLSTKFGFVIDSIKMLDYDGQMLKTVFSTPLKHLSSPPLANMAFVGGPIDFPNIYAEKL